MSIQVERIAPIRGEEVELLAAAEYRHFAGVLDEVSDDDWSAPTDCAGWTVHDVATHVLGATEAHADLKEMAHQLRHGRRGLAFEVDLINDLQVSERRHLEPSQVADRFAACQGRAARRRRQFAQWLGFLPFRVGAPVNETWRMRYLFALIYTRDTWMHRIDICRATGREVVLSPGHDGRIIADVVRDWASRHRRHFRLTLTGPAGGTFHRLDERGGAVSGAAVEDLDMDAVEFARVVSGRATGSGLLATAVPF